MKQQVKFLGYYDYTVVLTYLGMLSGFTGIIFAFEGNSLNAICCLMLAGFCDMFDGAVASTKKNRTDQEKCFGIQIDSLSDLICFGVLPACITYAMSNNNRYVLAISAFYVLCGLIRLAYFNVDEQERQKKTAGSRELYYGLPITTSALVVPVIYGLFSLLAKPFCLPLSLSLVCMGILFLTPFPLKKPRAAGKICIIAGGVMEVTLMFFACLAV